MSERRGIRLAEVIAVVVAVALLVGLLMPAVERVRGIDARAMCLNNLKQLVLAAHSFNDCHGAMPQPGSHLAGIAADLFDTPGPAASVPFGLLPFLEQDRTLRDLLTALPPGGTTADVADVDRFPMAVPPNVLLCPADDSARDGTVTTLGVRRGVTNYAANLAVFGHRQYGTPHATIPGSFPDGTSTTVLFAERIRLCGTGPAATGPAWLTVGDGPADAVFAGRDATGRPDIRPPQPYQAAACDPRAVQSLHTGGVSVAMADGTVRTVKPTVSLATWRAAVLPNDGATPGSDW